MRNLYYPVLRIMNCCEILSTLQPFILRCRCIGVWAPASRSIEYNPRFAADFW